MRTISYRFAAIAAALVSIGVAVALRISAVGPETGPAALRAAETAAMERAAAAFGELANGKAGYELVCSRIADPREEGRTAEWQVECRTEDGAPAGTLCLWGPTLRPYCISWHYDWPVGRETREALRHGGTTHAAWRWACVTGLVEPGEVWQHASTTHEAGAMDCVAFRSGERTLAVLLNRRTGGLSHIVADRPSPR